MHYVKILYNMNLWHTNNYLGQETFIIETPFHGNLPVNAYMDCDSPEDIAQKVYSITGLQVPFMSLFIRYIMLLISYLCLNKY